MSPKNYNATHNVIQLPCGKCISCLLEYSRQWSLRCNHEASIHPKNCFITLTYSDSNLKSNLLIRKDFDDFIKRLRYHNPQTEIGLYGCGEYGSRTKRPHFHALLFNYDFADKTPRRKNKHGDVLYKSSELDSIWGLNDAKSVPCEIGSVTFKSAAYVARYHLKALIHGNRQDNPKPLTFKSRKYAIGKRWLEKNWKDIFNYGYVVFNDQKFSIPRYYERWLEKNHPIEYQDYVTQIKIPNTQNHPFDFHEKNSHLDLVLQRSEMYKNQLVSDPLTPNQRRANIIEQKTKHILNNKGD